MTDTGPAKVERIEVLQAVRAFAALGVLVHHTAHAANKYAGQLPGFEWSVMGRGGVDLFFVLSGFIILHATVGRGLGWFGYAWARVRRIYLPYWPVGLAMAALIFGALPHTGAALRGWFVSATLLPVGQPGLNVAWTLQHEIVFYAFLALGLFSGWWRVGLALWAAAILFFWVSGMNAPVGFQPIDAEFLMGITAWAAWRDGRRHIMLAASAALLVLAAALAIDGGGIERAEVMAVGAVFAALLPWLVQAEQHSHIRVPRILRFLGDASYSIYLIHALPLLALGGMMAHLGWAAIFVTASALGLAAGIAYHLMVEKPLLRLANKW